jgi:hypothetical protein
MESRYNLEKFPEVFASLKRDKRSFVSEETNYTKKIRVDGKDPILFSDDAFDPTEMKLINLVRSDVKAIPLQKQIPKVNETDIAWYESYGMENGSGYHVYKLDIDSAYWGFAAKSGIISERTDEFFKRNKGRFLNGPKPARLKALGSLATKKIVSIYEDGEEVEVAVVEGKVVPSPGSGRLKGTVVNDYNRNIYLGICLEIDMLMRTLAMRYYKHARYYYWDCIFLDTGVDIDDVVRYVNEDLGYTCKVDKTRIFANFSKGVNGSIIDVNKLQEKKHHEYPVRVEVK